VIIRPQHTCGGDSPLAAERQWFTDEEALAVVDAQLCGARAAQADGRAAQFCAAVRASNSKASALRRRSFRHAT
jgi:hypothetical protein